MIALRFAIACAVLTSFPLSLQANNFEEKKAQYVERLELQIQELDKAKTCASDSKNMGELRKCRKANKMAMKELKSKLKEKYSKKQKPDDESKVNNADDSMSNNVSDELNEK